MKILIICTLVLFSPHLLYAESYLFIFAHPDDDMFVHGTIADLTADGNIVNVIYATSGENGEGTIDCPKGSEGLKTLREFEASSALEAINVTISNNNPYFLRFPDVNNLDPYVQSIKDALMMSIDFFKPDVLVTLPRGGITFHPAHITISRIVAELFDSQTTALTYLQYCVSYDRLQKVLSPVKNYVKNWSCVADNSVNIHWSCVGKKDLRKAAARCYSSQFKTFADWELYIDNADYKEFMIKGIKGVQIYTFKNAVR